MRKRYWIMSVLFGAVLILVSACSSPAATTEPTSFPTATKEVATPVVDPTEPVVEETAVSESDTSELLAEDEPAVCEAYPLPVLPVREVDETDWVKGEDPDNAEITIYEYSDFQCPGCSGMATVLSAFLKDNPNVRLVYRHFPLSFHDKAIVTAEATEAAGAQGKFWEMHDIVFARKAEWEQLSEDDAREKLIEFAEELDLDVEQFTKDMEEGTYLEKIEAQSAESQQLQLPGTPTFIFNNIMFPSDLGLSYGGLTSFMSFLDIEDRFLEPPIEDLAADTTYQAVLETSQGDIVVDLLSDSSPVHVNSFIHLSENGWFDDSAFYFAQDDFVAVTGDPTSTGIGYPGYYCTGGMNGVFDEAGLVGMLGNGQFFVTLGEQASQLNGNFALIGKVVEGLDIAQAVTRRIPDDPSAPEADVLISVEIVEK
ncbi:MAG: thioredoxin domain-containing protein [Anaerolineae bacterium]|nr:thioredoxin domain-containing protein [Anaerolineae bacterium]